MTACARRVGGRIACVLLCALVLGAVHVQAAGERVDVAVVRYAGEERDYTQFRALLLDWVQNISDEIPRTTGTQYLDRLRMFEPASDFRAAAFLAKYWQETDSLEILQGAITPEASGRYHVRSRIYLGDLRGTLSSSSILLEQPYSVTDYADTKDSHLAVLFYGLAMDAQRVDPSRRALIAEFLGAAKGKLRDIRRRGKGTLPAALTELETAVGKATKDLEARK